MPAVLKPARTGVAVSSGPIRQVSSAPVGSGIARGARRPSDATLRETRRAQLVSAASRSATSMQVHRDLSPDDDDSSRVGHVRRSSNIQAVPQRTFRSGLSTTGAATSGSQQRARLLPRGSASQSQGNRRLTQELHEQQSAASQRRGSAVLVSRARKQDQSHASHTEARTLSSPRSAMRGESQQGFAVRVIRAHGDNLRGDNLFGNSLRSENPRGVFSSRRVAPARSRDQDEIGAGGHRTLGRRALSRDAFNTQAREEQTPHQAETPRQARARERETGGPASRALLGGRGMRRHAEHPAPLFKREMLQDDTSGAAADAPRDAGARGRAVVLSSKRAEEARREREVKQQLDRFQQMSDELELQADDLQKESDDLNAQLADQEDAESELLKDKAQLRTNMDEIRAQEEQLQKEQEDLQRLVQEMKKREDMLNGDAATLKRKREEMSQREEEHGKREQSLRTQKEDLQRQSQELREHQDGLKSQLDEVRRKSEALRGTGQILTSRQASGTAAATKARETDRDIGPVVRRRAAKEEPEDAEPPAKRPRREASAALQASSAAMSAGRSAVSAPAKPAVAGNASAVSVGRAATTASGSATTAPTAARKRVLGASAEQAPAEQAEDEVEEENLEEEWFEGEEEEWFEGEEEEYFEGEEEEFFEGGEEENWEGEEEDILEGEEEEECMEDAEAEDALVEGSENPEKSIETKQEIEEAVGKAERGDPNDHWEMRSRSRSRERTRGESAQVAAPPEAEKVLEPHHSDIDEKERRRKDHIERRRAEVRAMSIVGQTTAAAKQDNDQKLRPRRNEATAGEVDLGPSADRRSRHTAASFNHPSASDGRRDRRPPSPSDPPRRARMPQGGGMRRRPRWSGTAHMDRGH